MCQRDLKPGTKTRSVRVVDIGGGPYSVHPDDETQFDAEGATIVAANGYRDLGQCLIGLDCAKAHGLEWTKRDRKSTRLNSSHQCASRMPSSAGKTKNKK